MSALRDWLASRTPAPPDALILPVEDASGDPTATLAEAGALVLAQALTGQGERSGAYDLLAADGSEQLVRVEAADGAEGGQLYADDLVVGHGYGVLPQRTDDVLRRARQELLGSREWRQKLPNHGDFAQRCFADLKGGCLHKYAYIRIPARRSRQLLTVGLPACVNAVAIAAAWLPAFAT